MATEATHRVRSFELNEIIQFLPKNAVMLEIGAGDGWQAKQLSKHCANVYAVDVEGSRNTANWHFPVQLYDGYNLPFESHFFDVVYSSNVLEHVVEIEKIQSEMGRVLKPGGIAIHCVPSATWRVWTSLGHLIYIVKLIFKSFFLKFIRAENLESTSTRIKNTRWSSLLKLILISPRHGEHGSALSEIILFSRRYWLTLFPVSDWTLIHYHPSHIFYTGNEIFGTMIGVGTRSKLSRIFGSSTHIFIYEKKPHVLTN
jgi:SAM-dependent methyltransferase